ncbi:hypothetical protein AMS68_000953 [Peltaster fructicola]|uniref:Alternative oxidase n=1 Tax=Peltaster fructicola TaxID=286661 RepID=A0A6H0XL46_9PEZI|nr:hypothetical protein AMS68_000953 [Peltaster fructicola]
MSCTRATTTRALLSKQSAASLLQSLNGSKVTPATGRSTFVGFQHGSFHQFSTSQRALIKEFFPKPDTPNIRTTEAAWQHPVYSPEQMSSIAVAHRETKNWSDYVALTMVRILRFGLDTVSGYKHDQAVALGHKDPAAAHKKNIFLESVAGVPGMVAGMLRHLHSMRRMKRDNGWIETLLEESYNERMHLLTFLKMGEPGPFMRLMVLGAQGVFFNAMFVAYLISPRTCHRFVGYLEEEAVITYTRELADLDAGRLPKWEKMQAPDIAIQYWKMPEGSRSMRDLLLYIRADEAKHREVNHTLAGLNQQEDPNPYASQYKDESIPHPTKSLHNLKSTGWERDEVL